MDRRSLLLSAGSIGGLLGLGSYHQRRRLRRWDDRDALRTARDRDRPTLETETTLTVSDEHLETARDDLEELLAETRAAWPDFEDQLNDLPREVRRAQSRLEAAEDTLSDAADRFADSSDRTPVERLELLEDLRDGLRSAGHALAFAQVERNDRDTDDVVDELDTVEDEYERVSEAITYYADDLPWAVAAYGDLDDYLEGVRTTIASGRRALERGDSAHGSDADPDRTDWIGADELARASIPVFVVEALLEDIEHFEAHLHDEADTTTDAAPTLESRYESLEDDLETRLDAIDFSYDDERSSYARDIWTPFEFDRSDGSDERRRGRIALAVRLIAERDAVVRTLEEFADMPSLATLNNDDPLRSSFETTGEDVLEAARSADETLENRLEADGDHLLVHHLCTVIIEDRDWTDTRLERTLDDINEDSDEEWTLALERLRLGYLEVEAFVTELPAVLEAIGGT
ncbi:hypothetical protein G6M89_12915 [Natronolimnobius sp. AArcel1]|uniref:hypothetical protein n=1 Tax=Natronolimnobius sp. AArcel1 TaxID=1679093 RepID=UPI0013EDBF0D|nr:hypothetical protein [Natronolimnobius sp. AArcel1]NGM69900.1 hypothetical protein [Natronolimnobius sp. AArcel1]